MNELEILFNYVNGQLNIINEFGYESEFNSYREVYDDGIYYSIFETTVFIDEDPLNETIKYRRI